MGTRVPIERPIIVADVFHRARRVRNRRVRTRSQELAAERRVPHRDRVRRVPVRAGRDGAPRHQADRRPDRRHRGPRPDDRDGAGRDGGRRRAVEAGTDLDFAAIDVQRRVNTARVFMPSDLDPPTVQKNGAEDPILTYAVSCKTMRGPALADMIKDPCWAT